MVFLLFIKRCSGELRPLHNHAIKPLADQGKTPRTLNVLAPVSYKGDYRNQKELENDAEEHLKEKNTLWNEKKSME